MFGHDDELTTLVPVILAVMSLIYQIHAKFPDWINTSIFDELAEFIFLKCFNEKMPIRNYNGKDGDQSIYVSDEWLQLIAYAIWVSYQANISLQMKLPLSSDKGDKDNVNWVNACWLFLAQRIAADIDVDATASKLFANEDNLGQQWLLFMKEAGNHIQNSRSLPANTHYQLASSPKGAFDGFRLVTQMDTHNINLATVISMDNPVRFANSFLELHEET